MAGEQSAGASSGGAQPGQVVVPGGIPQPAPPTAPENSSPAPSPQPQAPQPPTPLDNTPPPAFDQTAAPQNSQGGVSWTASEFIAHDKSASWYFGLTTVALVIAGFVYLVTRDIISTVVVLVGAFCLGVLAARKPRQLQYQLGEGGITIGSKYHDLNAFRSFSIVPEGAFSSIVFMPLKRFAPLLTIYYAPADEEKIVGLLAGRLPIEEHKGDAVDNLMRRIRF